MRYAQLAAIVSLTITLLVASVGSAQQDPAPALEAAAAYGHQNLTVVALHKTGGEEAPSGDYLTFDDATDKGVIEVTELEGNTADARVQKVEVTNTAGKPIFLMAGEIVLGGKQDRVISQNTIVPPETESMEVDVFCVERGRWEGKTAEFQSSGKMGHSKLRQKAQTESQQAVWDEVAKTNDKQKAKSSTGSYRASLEKADRDTDVSGYVEAIVPKLRSDKRAVGIAVAIDGKMIAVDAFANPALFAQTRKKLVESYALEAAASEEKKTDADVSTSDAETFLKKAAQAKKETTESKGDAANTKYKGDAIKGTKTESKGETVHQFYRAY